MASTVSLASDDYVLGTQQAEIARLGLQHNVWRPRVLDFWKRAGVTTGQSVADIGAGPGFATRDLAELVGPQGSVLALERSQQFIDALQNRMEQAGLSNVTRRRLDLDHDEFDVTDLDATWCRWVLSFVKRPDVVVGKISAALKPGGRALFHEYIDYGAWRLVPAHPSFDGFVAAVMASWREAGGEPDVALSLPTLLAGANLRMIEAEPLSYLVGPTGPMWAWLEAFVVAGAARLGELGFLSAADRHRLHDDFAAAKSDPNTRMMAPIVLEVVAVK